MISGRVQALNLTVGFRVGSGQTISGTGRVRASVLSPCRPLLGCNYMQIRLHAINTVIISISSA